MVNPIEARLKNIDELIEENLNDLTYFGPGYDEKYQVLLDNILKLTETQQELVIKQMEIDAKKKKDKEQRYFDIAKIITDVGLGIAGIIVPALGYAVFVDKMLAFEAEGTPTSTVFKSFIGKLTPFKK